MHGIPWAAVAEEFRPCIVVTVALGVAAVVFPLLYSVLAGGAGGGGEVTKMVVTETAKATMTSRAGVWE